MNKKDSILDFKKFTFLSGENRIKNKLILKIQSMMKPTKEIKMGISIDIV